MFAPMAEPWLESLGNLNLILFFVGSSAPTVLAGVPIAMAFAVGTFSYMVLTTDVPMLLFVGRFYEGMSHLILLAVPLFVFLGLLIEMTGMARAMVDFLGVAAGPYPRWPVLRSGRRDVSRVGHLGIQGRRHGRRGTRHCSRR